jgi:glycosyltransferase involved in cell wall biosynthesis
MALRRAAANVAIGSNMAERVTAIGVSAANIRVIPNWADEHAIQPIAATSSRARQAWGLKTSDFVIGYSGNLGQAHEVETLASAARLLGHRTDLRFLFIGGGRQHQRLQSLIREHNLKNFIFLPHQPREELSDTLAAADVHWLSLRPELEGLIVPSKLYGILAAGRPVLAVCDERGEAAKVVQEHKCGFVVQPGDGASLARAIEMLAEDSELRQKMGDRSRAASEQNYSKHGSLTSWSQLIFTLSRESGANALQTEPRDKQLT